MLEGPRPKRTHNGAPCDAGQLDEVEDDDDREDDEEEVAEAGDEASVETSSLVAAGADVVDDVRFLEPAADLPKNDVIDAEPAAAEASCCCFLADTDDEEKEDATPALHD